MTPRSLNLSPSDIDALSRIVSAEARGESDQGQLAVLFTILNRAAAKNGGFPDSVTGVIEQRGQFEPMSGKSSWSDLEAAPELRRKVEGWVSGIASGQVSDPTGGATFFQNTAITNRRGTNFAGAAGSTAEIGNHSFYDRYRNNDPVEVSPFRLTLNGQDAGAPTFSQLFFDPSQADPSERVASAFDATAPTVLVPAAPGMGDPLLALAAGLRGEPAPAPSMVAVPAAVPFANPDPTTGYTDPMGSVAYGASPDSTKNEALAASSQGQFGLRPTHEGVDLSGLSEETRTAATQAANWLGRDLGINSGYRSQEKQDRLRAAGNPNRSTIAKVSQHTHGNALDFDLSDLSDAEKANVYDALAAAGFTGFGYYGTYGHADMRDTVPNSFDPRRGWGGWTSMPPAVIEKLVARGFASGAAGSGLRRGWS